MNIGLYQDSVNSNLLNYKGLYRQNSIVDLYESKNSQLKRAINWYLSVSKEGLFLKYSESNKIKLVSLYKILKTKKWKGEVILFTDNIKQNIPDDFEFVGYDICADSKYFSPLGDGFLNAYNKEDLFFCELSVIEYETFKNNINNYGLFDSYDIALKFSQYCNSINIKYEHIVENENNWRVFAIYEYR